MSEYKATDPRSIQEMFGRIAGKYDLANSVLSLGIHRGWRKRLVKWSRIQPDARVLDCATGTGDLAFEWESHLDERGSVVGSDFCQPMLDNAVLKAQKRGSRARFEWADVMKLPYPDAEFDLVSISFGIRNVADPQKGLSELGRVLKPGGQLFVLEFGQPELPVLKQLYRFYSTQVLPQLGGWVSGEKHAYSYLESSSARFPYGERFLELARSTGRFRKAEVRSLHGGIAYLYRLERA